MKRFLLVFELLLSMRQHEIRAARTWINTMYPEKTLVHRLRLFFTWSLKTIWETIPNSNNRVQFKDPVSKTPVLLKDKNPLENHPWGN